MNNAVAGFVGAIIGLALFAVGFLAWKKVSEFLKSLNRVAVGSAQVAESLNKYCDTFKSIEKLLEGMGRLCEAQVQATVRLEKAVKALNQHRAAPEHHLRDSSLTLTPDPDDASREFQIQQLARQGIDREDAELLLDGDNPDGSDGMYASLRGGLAS